MSKMVSRLTSLPSLAVAVAAANVLMVIIYGGTYDFHIGFIHLVSHGLFKPLLILNGAFLVSILAKKPRDVRPEGLGSFDSHGAIAVIAALAILYFGYSLSINAASDEWNYRGLSLTLKAPASLARLFTTSQVGAWYRPLGFLSLWLDSRVFSGHTWGYHLQNILSHVVNALLAIPLSR